MLRTEKVRLADWQKRIREIIKQLDRTNIRILTAMWKYGPRNLLEVSRRTGIPFTSVYHRVAKLETKSKRFVSLIPQVSKLGLVRVIVLVTSRPGSEDRVTMALKVPNYWRSVNRCEGIFTHFSVHLVPAKFLKQFRSYVKRLAELDLITQSNIILTGEYIPNFPNFSYYHPATNEWAFQWARWLASLKRKPSQTIEDPASYQILADKKDMLIVKELEKNARKSFADLAPLLGISLQGVKYHYDKKLVPTRIVNYFGFDVRPYPGEVSAYHEILLKFTNSQGMNRFYSSMNEFFFVLGMSKVLHQNSLLVRTYTLQTQVPSLFTFLSQMAQEGLLESYSAVRQDFMEREAQTISYELFDQDQGWTFDLKQYRSELSKLAHAVTVRRRV
ncbi:MAG: winged helix-turn-helix transcriptional regulator [Candidatus Bathyarchaeia archaeon]